VRIAFTHLREAGIKSFAFFIYGYPGETADSMERTRDTRSSSTPTSRTSIRRALSGTELYEKCKREGLLTTDDWTKMEYSYYVLQGTGWTSGP